MDLIMRHTQNLWHIQVAVYKRPRQRLDFVPVWNNMLVRSLLTFLLLIFFAGSPISCKDISKVAVKDRDLDFWADSYLQNRLYPALFKAFVKQLNQNNAE